MSTYSKRVISKSSVPPNTIDNINNIISSEDETAKHYFHKIIVFNWTYGAIQLYEALNDYFGASFIPVGFSISNITTSFYTSSLTLVLKIIKLDCVLPFNRNMHMLEIVLNDKSSLELFNEKVTLDDIISSVVSKRFSQDFELDLSSFFQDPELTEKKIHFYKVSLLCNYKILMLRMGRDVKILNLSSNNFGQVPQDILNFFIKGVLIGINLSYNKIASLEELYRMNSKIEKLWVEGNPLCENLEPGTYVKEIIKKFPRLIELDGVRINNHGVIIPFQKYFMPLVCSRTKVVAEQFVSLYFSHYDSDSRYKVGLFYDLDAQISLSSNLNDIEKESMPKLAAYSRNALKLKTEMFDSKLYKTRDSIVNVLCALPASRHDLAAANVDVLKHEDNVLILTIDGVFKEQLSSRHFNFRRSFVLKEQPFHDSRIYLIVNEMFTISLATNELIQNSFKFPIRHTGDLRLINPTPGEKDTLIRMFAHLTYLKKSEAELLLDNNSWNLRESLIEFMNKMAKKQIWKDKFLSDEEHRSLVCAVVDLDEVD